MGVDGRGAGIGVRFVVGRADPLSVSAMSALTADSPPPRGLSTEDRLVLEDKTELLAVRCLEFLDHDEQGEERLPGCW